MAGRRLGKGGLYQPQDEQQAKLIFEDDKERKADKGKLLLNGGLSYDGESLEILSHGARAGPSTSHLTGVHPSDHHIPHHDMNSVVRGSQALPRRQEFLHDLHGFSPHQNVTVQTYQSRQSVGISHTITTSQMTFDLDPPSQSRSTLIPRGRAPVTELVSNTELGLSFPASNAIPGTSFSASNMRPGRSFSASSAKPGPNFQTSNGIPGQSFSVSSAKPGLSFPASNVIPSPSFSGSSVKPGPSFPASSGSLKTRVAPSRSIVASEPPSDNETGHKLRLKISKGTKVDSNPSPVAPPPDVIVIEDDDEEENVEREKPCYVTVPESAQNDNQTVVTENKPVFPEKYIPNMHLLNLPTFDESFVDIRNKKSGKQAASKISTQYFEESINKVTTGLQGVSSTSHQGSSVGIQPVCETGGDDGMGINVRMGEGMSQEEIMRMLEMITPNEIMNVDLSGLDLEMEEEEKNLKKQKFSSYMPYKVVTGEKEAVVQLLNDKDKLTNGTHGVICDALEPSPFYKYDNEEFMVKRVVGKGSYGTVDLCEDKTTRREFVKKKVTRDFRNTEVLIMLYLDHVNITKLYGYIQRDGQPEVLMEFVGVSLLGFVLTSPDRLDNDTIWNLSKQGLSALEYLDNHSIIHLDLKPENICVVDNASSLTLKLTDFGSAKTALENMSFQGLTAEYMAPEISRAFLRSKYPNMFESDNNYAISGKCDVFAFALVVMYMFQKFHVLMHFFTEGKASYKEVENPDRIRLNIIVAGARKPQTVKSLMITDKCSTNMRTLLEGMLEGCPAQRLSAREVLCKMDVMEKGDIYQQPMSPLEVLHSYIPSETSVSVLRHRLSINSSVSVCSMDVSSPGSPGPVKNIPERRKVRRRSQKPYDGGVASRVGDSFQGIQVAENVQGNVPNFLAL